ncbi:MAG TPA: P-loop NTPase [Vicinamibacteria bacterium]|nr:P-loop NTPase [Vicinamibacteria bacterium]
MALSVSEALPAPLTRRQIWSVGGGKGGIGKSLLAASVGWQLARMGRQVVLVDADLGGANLHTCLGLPMPQRTLADFIQRRVSSIEEVVTDTAAPGLRLVSGAGDLLSAANIKHLQKVRVMNQVRALEVDVVLIDLGAGTSYNILDFFLLSDVSILAVVPEPTSIENGYRFIKSALYRRMRAAAPTESARRLVNAALDPRSPSGIKTPVDLLARMEEQEPESAQALRREVAAFQPRFVVNEIRDVADVAIGHQLVAACGRHLGVRATYAGFVHHDDAVWQAVRRRRLFMADAPTSRAAEEIRQLTRGLVKGESLGSGY